MMRNNNQTDSDGVAENIVAQHMAAVGLAQAAAAVCVCKASGVGM